MNMNKENLYMIYAKLKMKQIVKNIMIFCIFRKNFNQMMFRTTS